MADQVEVPVQEHYPRIVDQSQPLEKKRWDVSVGLAMKVTGEEAASKSVWFMAREFFHNRRDYSL